MGRVDADWRDIGILHPATKRTRKICFHVKVTELAILGKLILGSVPLEFACDPALKWPTAEAHGQDPCLPQECGNRYVVRCRRS